MMAWFNLFLLCYDICVSIYAYMDLLYKHMGNNMVLGVTNKNLIHDPNSYKSMEIFPLI